MIVGPQVPRPLRQADSLEESGRWLNLHPPYATRILRRDDFLKRLVLYRRLYEKNDPGRRTGRFGTQARIALTSDIRHGWFPRRSKGSVGTGPSVASFSSVTW